MKVGQEALIVTLSYVIIDQADYDGELCAHQCLIITIKDCYIDGRKAATVLDELFVQELEFEKNFFVH